MDLQSYLVVFYEFKIDVHLTGLDSSGWSTILPIAGSGYCAAILPFSSLLDVESLLTLKALQDLHPMESDRHVH
jgi:hypothetical protein